MNANRTKYAVTPTYGMQKHGLFGKKPVTARDYESPDFSQGAEPEMMTAPYSVPQQGGYPLQQNNVGPTQSPYFMQSLTIPVTQQMPPYQMASPGYPQSAAASLQQNMPRPGAQNFNAMNSMVYKPNVLGYGQPPAYNSIGLIPQRVNQQQPYNIPAAQGTPLGYPAAVTQFAGYPIQGTGMVSGRAAPLSTPYGSLPFPSAYTDTRRVNQPYGQSLMQPLQNFAVNPGISQMGQRMNPMPSATSSPANPVLSPYSPMPPLAQPANNPQQQTNYSQQSPIGSQMNPYQTMPVGNQAQQNISPRVSMPSSNQPFTPIQPQAMPTANPPRRPQSEKNTQINTDRFWMLLLIGTLLLFVPCLFVSRGFDFLRYLFIGCTVCGLGAIWYRQMYTSTIRLVVSCVYVALCIVTIAMMTNTGRDVQQTLAADKSAQLSQPVQAATVQPQDVAAPTAAPTASPEPTLSGPSQAEQRLTTFMQLWSSNSISEMVAYVQPSWAAAQENPTSQLFILIANRTAESFTIEEISGSDSDSARTVTMSARINKNTGKEPVLYRFMVQMVSEGNEWYVDPNSLATNDQLTEAEVIVATSTPNVDGITTEPPRTTVTPAPPASTLLYYNVNGGKQYHMDPNCPSIDVSYLPLTGSFAYSELGTAPNNKLTPCLKCGAPTQTLPPE